LDGTHTHFIHPGLIRSNHKRSLVNAIIRANKEGVEVEYTEERRQSGLIASLFERSRSKSYGRFKLPSTAQLEYCSKNGTTTLITVFLTPENGTRLKAYIVTAYQKTFLPGWLSHFLIKPFFYLALKQDLQILRMQSDNITLFQDEDFHSTELDLIRIPVRQLLSQNLHPDQVDKMVQLSL
jgi:hypothetical protein